MRAWAVLATVGLMASAAAAVIYRQLIVPQLPSVQSVPLTWWTMMLLPVGLVVVWAGYRSRSLSQVLASAAAIVLPWVLVEAVYGLVTARPVAHDVWVFDPAYWLSVALKLLLCGIAVGLTAVMSRWFRPDVTASNRRVNPAAGAPRK